MFLETVRRIWLKVKKIVFKFEKANNMIIIKIFDWTLNIAAYFMINYLTDKF